MYDDIDTDLKARFDMRIRELEDRICAMMSTDKDLADTSGSLLSIPGIGPVASRILIAKMPELGVLSCEKAASLAGFASVADDSGTLRGKRAIAGGRRAVRRVKFQAALVAAHHNPSLKHFAERLRKVGKPHKAIITVVAESSSPSRTPSARSVKGGLTRRTDRYSC